MQVSKSIVRVVSSYLVIDVLILCSYYRNQALYGGTSQFYGKKKLILHIFSSLLFICNIASAIYFYPNATLSRIAAISSILVCGPSSLILARYTAGYKCFSMFLYFFAGLAWMVAGFLVLFDVYNVNRIFELFVFSHTFSIVRIFFWLHSLLGLPGERKHLQYSSCIFFASLSSSIIAWGEKGAFIWTAVAIFCVFAEKQKLLLAYHASNFKPIRY